MKINVKISSKNEGKVTQLNDGKLSDKNRKILLKTLCKIQKEKLKG